MSNRSDEGRMRAEALFKKPEQQTTQGQKAWAEHASAARTADANRAKLKSQRLAKRRPRQRPRRKGARQGPTSQSRSQFTGAFMRVAAFTLQLCHPTSREATMYLVIRKFSRMRIVHEAARRAESGIGKLMKEASGFRGY